MSEWVRTMGDYYLAVEESGATSPGCSVFMRRDYDGTFTIIDVEYLENKNVEDDA